MDFVQPRTITSPSGHTCKPQIKTFIRGNQEITEAHWIDPASGAFFYKGVISVKDLSPKEKKP